MSSFNPVKLALHAMATRFELVLHGDDPARLRAAGEEALHEIGLLEKQLSLYRSESDIARINARAGKEPIKVEPQLFSLIQRAIDLSDVTDGAFDITIGPLMRAWGLMSGQGRIPSETELDFARAQVGVEHIRLDEARSTVALDREGMQIDLGAIGKGYAIARAVEILKESGVTSALLHGGTSTIHALGAPPDAQAWRVAIYDPVTQSTLPDPLDLHDSSLSVSAVHGKSFTSECREYGHVIDPRTGRPTNAGLLAAVWGPSPTETDALSTALLVLGEPGLEVLHERMPDYRGLVLK